MRISYKLMILTSSAEKLFKRWTNQGWDPTVASSNKVTTIVWLDLVTDKNTDPTALPGVVRILQ